MKLSTAIREYESLTKLSSLCFSQQLLKPADISFQENRTESIRLMQSLNLNFPQAAAVNRSVSQNSGFILIQGPPGTGKTKTILGIAGAHLSARGTAISFPGQSNNRQQFNRKKILVCAPSNAAVDEICRRVTQGILNPKGVMYSPNVLRIGNESGISQDCLHVSLNYKIEQILKQNIQSHSRTRDEIRMLERDLKFLLEDESTDNNGQQVVELRQRIKSMKQVTSDYVNIESERKKLYADFVNESEILLCTLSGAGHESLAGIPGLEFEATIIDEACQVDLFNT